MSKAKEGLKVAEVHKAVRHGGGVTAYRANRELSRDAAGHVTRGLLPIYRLLSGWCL
jgi:hypothetical protein